MFHRHFDDCIHYSHGGPGHHGFGRGPFRGWRSRGRRASAAAKAGCSTAESSGW